MPNCSPQRLRPVLKRPRLDWTIPAADEYQRRVLQKEENARYTVLYEGTTAQGRDVFRKIIERAQRLIKENPSIPEAAAQLETELNGLRELWQEFQILLCKVCGLGGLGSQEISGRELAVLLVVRARLFREFIQRSKSLRGSVGEM